MTLPHIFYALQNGFSGQSIFDDEYIQFYNAIFTAGPVFVRAVFDQDIHYGLDGISFKKHIPQLYYLG